MPLVQYTISPRKLSSTKLNLAKNDSEFIAVNNGTLVNVLRQLASVVTRAGCIFAEVAVLAEQVSKRVRNVKLRLDELEAKAELFDPKLVPVPEGHLDDVSIRARSTTLSLDSRLFVYDTRSKILMQLYDRAGKHEPSFPPRSPVPIAAKPRRELERHNKFETRRPASVAALREWKLDDYLDEKIVTLDRKPQSSEELNRALSSPFPSQLVQVDVTGKGFDRQKANRRSLIIHTKKVRSKKRRNTICGSIPNKECGIQTSFSSVAPTIDNKHYGIDSGHWSSCTSSAPDGAGPSSSSAPSPWDPISLSTSSDFLFDDEERSLTPQLENFTDGLVSDSDSVDTEGYFTSFRNECGFPKSKKSPKEKDDKVVATTENEYELFGKGSTSTTASSCGTVVLRNKPEPPTRAAMADPLTDKKSMSQSQSDDAGWEERVKRKSLIELVPSLVVVTPSPSCSSGSPPPLKDPGLVLEPEDSDSGRITPKAGFMTGSEYGTQSDTDSDLRRELKSSDVSSRPSSTTSSTASAGSSNSTLTLTSCATTNLPQPDVIPDVQQLQIIRTKSTPKLDVSREYYALDTVLLGSSEEEHHDSSSSETKTSLPPNTSGKVRGARVVLDANGEIVFSSETLRRKRRQKVSFDPGNAVRTEDYESGTNYSRVRESVYERIKKDTNEKLYECIEEIRRHNLKASDAMLDEKRFGITSPLSSTTAPNSNTNSTRNMTASPGPGSVKNTSPFNSSPNNSNLVSAKVPPSPRAKVNVLMETDLDSAIPPEMPALKNLSKIKDRLKRNESYRIATDEIPPAPRHPLHSLTNKRINLANNKNAKRDIPEEDPVFIQQILNMNSTTNNSTLRSPNESFSRSPLSKFALSLDDRPSFLRRESPPTMDEIAKEIYRFRKKFNIQPNASSSNLRLSSAALSRKSSPSVASSSPTSSVLMPNSKIYSSKTTPRKLQPPLPAPLSSSTPVKQSASHFQRLYPTRQSYSPFSSSGKPPSTLRSSLQGNNKIYPMSTNVKPTEYFYDQNSLGMISPIRNTHQFSSTRLSPAVRSTSGTSLGDFKKLLLATQRKRSSISAVEVLKPRIGMETTL